MLLSALRLLPCVCSVHKPVHLDNRPVQNVVDHDVIEEGLGLLHFAPSNFEAAPDVVLASWCGKKVRRATIESRTGWSTVPAIVGGHVYEIKSTYILQPGPASLTEGVRQVHDVLCRVAGVEPVASLAPDRRP